MPIEEYTIEDIFDEELIRETEEMLSEEFGLWVKIKSFLRG
jgi:hypothetical protein